MRARGLWTTAAVLALVTALSSCSDEDPPADDGGPIPPPTGVPSSSTPAQALPHSGAPPVASPVADTARWEGDPCSVITVQQLSSIGLTSAEPERDDLESAGPGCLWDVSADAPSLVSGGFATAGKREGLSTIYKNHQVGALTLFEELPPIEGHPAVVADPKDERSTGACAVGVGLRDDLVYTVAMTADPSTEQGKDPCAWAAKVAALAMQTMKGSS